MVPAILAGRRRRPQTRYGTGRSRPGPPPGRPLPAPPSHAPPTPAPPPTGPAPDPHRPPAPRRTPRHAYRAVPAAKTVAAAVHAAPAGPRTTTGSRPGGCDRGRFPAIGRPVRRTRRAGHGNGSRGEEGERRRGRGASRDGHLVRVAGVRRRMAGQMGTLPGHPADGGAGQPLQACVQRGEGRRTSGGGFASRAVTHTCGARQSHALSVAGGPRRPQGLVGGPPSGRASKTRWSAGGRSPSPATTTRWR